MRIHYLEKGKDRTARLGEPSKSQSICGDTEGTSAVHAYMVNCEACVRELLKLKIKEMGLEQIPNNFGHAGRNYCKSPDGDLYCIQTQYSKVLGLYSADKNGEPITLIYPR